MQKATVMTSPPAIHSTPWRWPNRLDTGAIRYTSQIAEKNQRHGLPVPGTSRVPRAVIRMPGRAGVAWCWSVAIACSPHIHAATLPGAARPGPRAGRPAPSSAGSDRLGRRTDREDGQRDEDREPDHDADHVDGGHAAPADDVRGDLDHLVGRRELAELLQRAAQREPQAAEDREGEEHHDGDRLDRIRVELVPEGDR